jgi:CheY-like chemotaxis protein
MVLGQFLVERRKWPRAQFSAMARVSLPDGPSEVFGIHNLSAGGALLVGDAGFVLGDEIEIALELPRYGYVSMDARIVRVETNDCGNVAFAVTFPGIDPALEDAIHNAVLYHLEEIHTQRAPIVLVVDENQKVCRNLSRDLEALDRVVLSALSRNDAVDLLRSDTSRIDTTFVDLFPGRSDGIELLTFLSTTYPSIRRVLMVSKNAAGLSDEYHSAVKIAHAVLRKPWRLTGLIEVLELTRPMRNAV